jgi:trigger factor
MEPGEFIQVLDQNGQIPAMVGEVARNKAIAVVLGKATVVDTNGKAIDLTGFVPEADDASADEASTDAAATDEVSTDEVSTDAAATNEAADEKPAKKAPAKKAAAKKPAAKKAAAADDADAK